ncbi:MAG TPA: hypothetical protein VNA19_04870 [Pyrinomonadaceae bacterium]|jgi:hypothetical protein|nr:hypothetical protein [Pyrinomonadaceae bacterium]
MFNQIQSFPCPSCREIINDTMQTCKYCGAPIDKGIAQAAAEVQSKVNQACSDASYLKTTALVMWVCLGLSFIPYVPLVSWGFLLTFIALVVLLIRWQTKFSDINTPDPDYQKARRSKNLAFILWLVALPTGFVIRPIISLVLSRLMGQL